MNALPPWRAAALLLILALCAAPHARAEAPATSFQHDDRAYTSGPALALGVGTQTVYLGGQLLYYLQLAEPRWRIALHLGAGGLPFTDSAGRYWGLDGGAFLAFGRRHRLVVGLEAGTLSWSTLALHGRRVAQHQLPGAGLSVGWEWMSRFGLFMRASLGPAFVVEPEAPLSERHVSPWLVGGWQVGYKPW